jgi:hypothetical protein
MTGGLKAVDVSNSPELLRLAEEVERTRQPRVLRRDRQDVAVVLPLTARTAHGRREQTIEAQIWADAGIASPSDVWADYDPIVVRAALQQARGALAGVDRDQLLRDICEAREQDPTTRPA